MYSPFSLGGGQFLDVWDMVRRQACSGVSPFDPPADVAGGGRKTK
jgi:hypothetical protein